MWLREAAGQDLILYLKRRVYANMHIASQFWSSIGCDLACSGLNCGGGGLFPPRTVLLKVMKSKCSKSVWQLKDCSVPSKSPMALNRTQSCFADGSTVKCIHLKKAVVQMSTCIKEKHNHYYSHISICNWPGRDRSADDWSHKSLTRMGPKAVIFPFQNPQAKCKHCKWWNTQIWVLNIPFLFWRTEIPFDWSNVK